jgi:DNA topoisomerase-1
VVLRLICEREKEVEKFIPEEYWSVIALLDKKDKKGNEFESFLIEKNNKKIPKLGIKNKKETEDIVENLKGAKFQIKNIQKKEVKRNPLPPFTTSTLQQTAGQRLRLSSQKTMFLAQRLYEKGLISYHRTDSLNISQEALSSAKNFIIKNFGKNYWPGFSKTYKTKSKGAQEAHEAIRPTNIEKTPENIKLDSQQLKLYKLIWQRFLASQMNQAIFDSINIKIEANNCVFQSNGQTLKFDGFLKIYSIKFKEAILPGLKEKEMLELIKLTPLQHFTKPPARYSEATLIKVLEENGIGRPSTYAPTISTVQRRNYAQKNEQRKFVPTEIGIVVNNILVEHFPTIVHSVDLDASLF